MPNPRIIARLETKKLRAELWINGIPAALLIPGEADGMVGVPLNEFLLRGTNKLGILLHAAPLASRAADPWPGHPLAAEYTGGATLKLRLAQYEEDQPVQRDDAPAILTVEWAGAAEPEPSWIEREFPGVAPLGPWAWERAQAFPRLDDGLRGRAVEYLTRLHELLAAGNFEAFLTESALKIEEYAAAYGIAPTYARNGMLQALQSQAAELKLRPLSPTGLDLRLVAGGRMIECLRTDRHSALEYAGSDGRTFFLPAMIGMLGADWRLLR